jgi:hypothetical protein
MAPRKTETNTKTSQYSPQPPYKATLKPANGGKVVVNGALADKPEYKHHVLFGRLTESEDQVLHFLAIKYWALTWVTILGHALFLYGNWVLCPLFAFFCFKHTANAHDCNHLKRPLPFIYRLTGYGLFCAGFLPLAPVYGDIAHQHIMVHHPKTKGVIDHDDHDPHSRLARMSLVCMLVSCAIMPGHVSLEDIRLHQYPLNPSHLWPERVATNLVHWAQLALLYHATHSVLASADCWACWHVRDLVFLQRSGPLFAVLHVFGERRPVWASQDPGARHHIFKCLISNAWLEIKWHDLHHAFGIANGTYGSQMVRGMTYDQIEAALADIVDEGLFLDSGGVAVSPLAEVGHKVGSRKAYLKNKQQ